MYICDRCNKNKTTYHTYAGGKLVHLCTPCHNELNDMQDVFISIETDFMKNKTLKHIDLFWE